MGEDSFRLGFGEFRGRTLDEVPLDYVIYLATMPDEQCRKRVHYRTRAAAAEYLKRTWKHIKPAE